MSKNSALSETKLLYKQMKLTTKPTPAATVKKWSKVVKNANVRIWMIRKEMNNMRQRFMVERSVMQNEMKGELLDREANSARTAERFRILNDKQLAKQNVYDRAVASATSVERAIAKVCSNRPRVSHGSSLLQQRTLPVE